MVQHRLPMLPSAGDVPWVASVNGVEKQLNIENMQFYSMFSVTKREVWAQREAAIWAPVAVARCWSMESQDSLA